jgi:hypothetical protein
MAKWRMLARKARGRRSLSLAALAGAATLTMAILAPPAMAASVSSGCFSDGGVDVHVCIHMDGSDFSTGGDHEQLSTNVTDYRITVTNVDPHDVVLGSTLMRATVEGHCTSGCSKYQDDQVWTKTWTPASGTVYKYAMPWKAASVDVDNAGGGVQAANAEVHFFYRGKKTTFQTPNVCLGSITASNACNF